MWIVENYWVLQKQFYIGSCSRTMFFTILQRLGDNRNYCSRPLLNLSHWDSADCIQLSAVNYGHTHLLWKELASFIFQGNKKQQKQQSMTSKSLKNLIWNEGTEMKRTHSRSGLFDAFWNVTMREREGEVKWPLAGRGPRASWVDTFNGCHLFSRDVKTSQQIRRVSRLSARMMLCLQVAMDTDGLYQARKSEGSRLDCELYFHSTFYHFTMYISKTSTVLLGIAVTVMTIGGRNHAFAE